jgi:hypothetical protein
MPLTLPAYPLINGLRPDWSSIHFTPNLPDGSAEPIVGIKSLNYKVEQDPVEVYGTGPTPIGLTRGTAKFSGDLEMYIQEFYAWVEAVGPDFGSIPINITVSYSESAFTKTDTLIGCRLISPEASQSQGADPLTRKFSLKMINISFNGVTAVEAAGAIYEF